MGMTIDEAIAILKHNVLACLHGTEWGEALEMAIKALEQEPCEDAISREAIKKDLKNCKVTEIRDEDDDLVGYYNADTVDSIVRNLPSVKPQERTGHWNLFHTTEHGIREDSYFKCDRCNYESYKEYNFCPKCGARMEDKDGLYSRDCLRNC